MSEGSEDAALREGWFLVTAGGRKWFIVPFGSARWCPKYINSDRSTWLPICKRLGFTTRHAMKRASRDAQLPKIEATS